VVGGQGLGDWAAEPLVADSWNCIGGWGFDYANRRPGLLSQVVRHDSKNDMP
jgi:hypothetical protein